MGSHIEENIQPRINVNHSQAAKFSKLWEIPDSFVHFVDTLLKSTHLDTMSGEELELFCKELSVDLFYPFSNSELRRIFDQGKIPNLQDWPEKVALDDLMTWSALQSFSKDQSALDNRIRSSL